MKFCKKCGQPKEGLCKPCRNARARAWAAANPDKVKAKNDKYYAANHTGIHAVNALWKAKNKDRVKELNDIRIAENREAIRARAAEYHLKNKEKHNERSAAWRLANPEKCRIQAHNRRARVADTGGRLSPNIFETLFVLQKGRCACCGEKLTRKAHLDHIVPISKGGTNEDSNMQLLTQKCNNEKHAKDPIAFMQGKGFLI